MTDGSEAKARAPARVQPHALAPGAGALTNCDALTSLRGIAAVAVVVQHCLLMMNFTRHDDPYLRAIDLSEPWLLALHFALLVFNGSAAVVLFFVLSGTVLALSILRDGAPSMTRLLGYWARRVFRLYPLLICATLFAATLFTIAPPVVGNTAFNSAFAHWLALVPGPADLPRDMLGLANRLNVPAWSITIEIIVSMIFPFLFLAMRFSTPALRVAIVLALALLAIAPPFRLRQVETFLFAFALGPLLLAHGAPVMAWLKSRAPLTKAVVWSIVAALGLGFERLYSPTEWNNGVSSVVMSSAAALLIAAIYFGPRRGWLYDRRLVGLGDIPYGIYLIHFPILIFFARTLSPTLSSFSHPLVGLAWCLFLTLVTLAITLPLAWLSHRVIEGPAQATGRRIARQLLAAPVRIQ